jgi:hypothetical protein
VLFSTPGILGFGKQTATAPNVKPKRTGSNPQKRHKDFGRLQLLKPKFFRWNPNTDIAKIKIYFRNNKDKLVNTLIS